jgi:hypothetical protein
MLSRPVIRKVTVAALTTMALSVAAPMASAAASPLVSPADSNPTMTSVQLPLSPEQGAELTDIEAFLSSPEGRAIAAHSPEIVHEAMASKAKIIWELIKKAGGPILKGAKAAAKKGIDGLKKWASGLSWWSPIRWAIKASPEWVLYELIDYILNS